MKLNKDGALHWLFDEPMITNVLVRALTALREVRPLEVRSDISVLDDDHTFAPRAHEVISQMRASGSWPGKAGEPCVGGGIPRDAFRAIILAHMALAEGRLDDYVASAMGGGTNATTRPGVTAPSGAGPSGGGGAPGSIHLDDDDDEDEDDVDISAAGAGGPALSARGA